MSLDADELGVEQTITALRQLLAERFDMKPGMTGGGTEDPLFAIGMGLSSLDGIEFLCEIEKLFGVQFEDLDWWVYETPTLSNVAEYVISLSKKQHAQVSEKSHG